MASPSWLRRLADGVLTTEPTQRLRLAQSGMAVVLGGVSVAVLHFIVLSGHSNGRLLAWWTAFAVGGLAMFFVLIRTGLSRRFDDPSLTKAQMLYAITVAAAAYAMAGPGRGAVFLGLAVVLMYGTFQLSGRAVVGVCTYAVALFGAVMLAMAWFQPAVYEPLVEAGQFLMLATTVPALAVLTSRLTRLRERLRRQKLELASALARIQELATRDELTGLVNRRYMLELLEQERQRCVRSGRTFCVALIDIDHFKQVNDRAGHAAGDEVLRSFTREAVGVLRTADVLARWGGDEFVLLLSDTRAPLARAGLERLRERVDAMRVRYDGLDVRLSLSIGLTEHIAGEAVAQALERADQALYDAKGGGRNRLVIG